MNKNPFRTGMTLTQKILARVVGLLIFAQAWMLLLWFVNVIHWPVWKVFVPTWCIMLLAIGVFLYACYEAYRRDEEEE